MEDQTSPSGSPLTDEQLTGPLVPTDAPEDELVDEEPVEDVISFDGWEGTGNPLTSGAGTFTRYRGHNVDIHKLPAMSCATGIHEAWMLRTMNYASTKKKEPSGQPLFDFLGSELFSSADPLALLHKRVKLPPAPSFDCNGLPHTLLINLQLPQCEKPALFGQALTGPTVNAALVFRLREDTARDSANDDAEHGIKAPLGLLKTFVSKLCPEVSKVKDDDYLGRFKLLVRSADGVPSAFSKYNGKPVLVTGSGGFSRSECGGVMEVSVNMRSWAYPARRALYSNWDRLHLYRLHVGVCIEGRSDAELAERLLGCCMLSLPTKVCTETPAFGAEE